MSPKRADTLGQPHQMRPVRIRGEIDASAPHPPARPLSTQVPPPPSSFQNYSPFRPRVSPLRHGFSFGTGRTPRDAVGKAVGQPLSRITMSSLSQASPHPGPPHVPATPRSPHRNPPWLWVWTAIATVSVLLLVQPVDPTRQASILKTGINRTTATSSQRFLRWLLLTHLALQPVYPWILVGPYIFWFTCRYPLERGRLRRALPVQLAAAIAAVGASTAYRHFVAARRPLVLVWKVVETHREHVEPAGAAVTIERRIEAGAFPPIHAPAPAATTTPPEGRSNEVHRNTAKWVIELDPEASPPGTNLAGVPPIRGLGNLPGRSARGAAFSDVLGTTPASSLLLDLLAFGALSGISHAVSFHRRYRERERRALTLETHLAQARLHTLQAQLQPHFLFNSLHSITALLREDPRAAEEMLVSLGELLRLALAQAARPIIPLRDEIRFLELYLEVQRFRFGPRLHFETQLDSATLDHPIPALLLQPLVENAVRHGMEPATGTVHIRIVAQPHPHSLELRVEDDGAGFPTLPKGIPPPAGVGLGNVTARLRALFGDRASLSLHSPPHGRGFVVRLLLPSPQPHPLPTLPPA